MEQPPGEGADPQVTSLDRPRRRAAMGFIFVTVLLDVIALGIMIPVLPNLIQEMVGGSSVSEALKFTALFAFAWGVLQFFAAPIQGMLSDRFGRRPILLISIFGLSVDYLFMALAPNLWVLFIGRVINGICAASFSTAGAYIADITAPENRARAFGLIGAAFSLGFIIGPGIGGELSKFGLHAPFYFAAALGMVNWLYGLFILPESLPKERRQPRFNWARANPVGSFRLLRRHHELFGLAGVFFLFQLAHAVFPTVYVLFVDARFGWEATEAGRMMMVVGLVGALFQGFAVGPLVKRLGERLALYLGMVSAVAGFLLYGLAPTVPVFLLAIPVFALSGLIGPSLQGIMTRRVEPGEQGQLQGANSAMMSLAIIAGPLIYPTALRVAVDDPAVAPLGLPYLIAASLVVLSLSLALNVRPVAKQATSST